MRLVQINDCELINPDHISIVKVIKDYKSKTYYLGFCIQGFDDQHKSLPFKSVEEAISWLKHEFPETKFDFKAYKVGLEKIDITKVSLSLEGQ